MRKIVAIVLLCLATGNIAGREPAKTLPVGKWQRAYADGSTLMLEISDSGATWLFEMPMRGTAKLIAPTCKISDEGIVFGYVKQASSSLRSASVNDAVPYAFKFRIEGDTLVISDFKMYDLYGDGHKSMLGTFAKVSGEGNMRHPDKSEKR